MSLQVKHSFGKIGDTRVSFVEKGVSKERMEFLKNLLEFNGFEVIIDEQAPKNEEEETKYTVAVTDMLFNPVIYIYDRRLKTPDGHYVTHDYWEQRSGFNFKPQYWENMYR